jgi:hypothetical protein
MTLLRVCFVLVPSILLSCSSNSNPPNADTKPSPKDQKLSVNDQNLSSSDKSISDKTTFEKSINSDGATKDKNTNQKDMFHPQKDYILEGSPSWENMPNPCRVAVGICVDSKKTCTDSGGTLKPSGDPGCLFDPSAQAYCCIPPAPEPSGNDCKSRGGLCVWQPGACLRTSSIYSYSNDGCTGTSNPICCLPPTACPSQNLECCWGTWTSFPLCDRGTWKCGNGTTPVPEGTCP